MLNRSFLKLIYFFALGIFIPTSYAYQSLQSRQDIFDENKLEELKKDSDYNYEEIIQQQSLWTDFKEWLSALIKDILGIEDFSGFWSVFFGLLPYVAIIIFISILVWYLVHYNTGAQVMRQHDKSNVILTEEEELLLKQNLDELAEKAIQKEQYRLAVRYLYLHTIKRLDMKNIITFSNEKTNYDYLKEIQYTELYNAFKVITISYEQVWYGALVFDKTYFNKLYDYFQKFHNTLDQPVYAKA